MTSDHNDQTGPHREVSDHAQATVDDLTIVLPSIEAQSHSYSSQQRLPFVHPLYGIFTSANSDIPPPFPLSKPFSSLESTQAPCCSDNRYPFLAMVPTSPLLSADPIVGGLRLEPGEVLKVEKVANEKWRLVARTISDWRKVEDELKIILGRLQSIRRWVLLEEASPPFPTAYGYQRNHKSPNAALVAAKRSHLAFRVLMGRCSFLIASRDSEDIHQWEIDLALQTPAVASGFIDLVRNSELNTVNSSCSKAGVILYPDCQFLRSAFTFQRHGAPVWIYWGREKVEVEYNEYLWVQRYKPDRAVVEGEFRKLRDREAQIRLCEAVQACQPPDPQEGSGQLKGETPWAYLERRAIEIAAFLQTADKKELDNLEKMGHAQTDHLPAFPGPTVWLWEFDKNAFPIKTRLNRTQTVHLFPIFKDSQRRYDPQNNHWDLFQCRIPYNVPHYSQKPAHFHTPRVYDYSNELSEITHSEMTDTHAAETLSKIDACHLDEPLDDPASLEAQALAELGSTDFDAGLQDAVDETTGSHAADQPSTLPKSIFEPDIEKSIYSRFGFSPLDHEQPSVSNHLPWNVVAIVLGIVGDVVPLPRRPAIQAFVSQMINNSTNVKALRNIEQIDISRNASFPLGHSLFEIEITHYNQNAFYSLISKTPLSPQPSWRLVTTDPTAVLQCVREDFGSNLRDAARFFLSNGISFNTFTPRVDLQRSGTPSTISPSKYTPCSLGYRKAKHTPGQEEYAAYQNLRDILLNRPYHRAALLEGGIVWRLALEAHDSQASLENCITSGPSEDSLARGATLKLHNGLELVDDALTKDELDLICGVYKWPTGNCSFHFAIVFFY